MRKTIYRSAVTGKIVTEEFANDNPTITTKEEINTDRQEIKAVLNSNLSAEEMIEKIKIIIE